MPSDWDGVSHLQLRGIFQNAIAETENDVISFTLTVHALAEADTNTDAGQAQSMSHTLAGGDEAQDKVHQVTSSSIEYNDGTYPIATGDLMVVKMAVNLGAGVECTGPLHMLGLWLIYKADKLGEGVG